MVLIDLYDATFLCQEHPEILEPTGTVIEITFRTNVKENEKLCVMTYKNGQWIPAEKVTINSNGSVTVVFEHLCPIAFAIDTSSGTGSEGGATAPEANPNTGASVFFGTAALVCAAAIASFKRK